MVRRTPGWAAAACLGPWLSPVIGITRRRQGIHDLLCGTVVEVIAPESRGGRLASYDPVVDAITPALWPRVVSTLGFSAVLVLVLITTALLMRVSFGADVRCGTFGTAFFEVLFRV